MEHWRKKKRCKRKELQMLGKAVFFSILLPGTTEPAISADQSQHPKIYKQELFLTAIIVCNFVHFIT